MAGERPEWLDWELELSPHLFRRMIDRRFNEVDIRTMLEEISSIDVDSVPGRWQLACRYENNDWIVVVEPDAAFERLVVVTAFLPR